MGGFLLNGFGARDYFKQIADDGVRMCPNCKKVTPFHYHRGRLKIAIFWIPTFTIKERYASLCSHCKVGHWLSPDDAQRILAGVPGGPEKPMILTGEASGQICPKCGAAVDSKFCKECGTEYIPPKPVQRICPNCGQEVDSKFCGACGTKYIEPQPEPVDPEPVAPAPVQFCPNCGAQAKSAFCVQCGTKIF